MLDVTDQRLSLRLVLSRADSPWIMADIALERILPRLTLKRISLINPRSTTGKGALEWNNLHQPLKSVLASVFSSPALESATLRGLTISSLVDLLSLFSEAASLKALAISCVFFPTRWEEQDTWPDTRPWQPRLTSLDVSETSGGPLCSHFLKSRMDLSRVKSLAMAWIPSRGSIEWETDMVNVSNTIEHFQIYCPQTLNFMSVFTPTLRSIQIWADVIDRTLVDIFRLCPLDAYLLETITLDGILKPLSSPMTIESTLSRLPSLKKVELRVLDNSGYVGRESVFPEWSATVLPLLSSLESRGLLRLTELLWDSCMDYWP
ncbi:hypothetical protein FB45DRAFT_1067490 [Roridomyces roridus]|uniref:Uncharacterized protein n=1 Tax=Roridomyces roridus TaxID=1738132 RepID=A0AAD7F8B3_9AGAR|nr:hypothetical protein FB45DRAFT_1067490 [Roridomyces roridus]